LNLLDREIANPTVGRCPDARLDELSQSHPRFLGAYHRWFLQREFSQIRQTRWGRDSSCERLEKGSCRILAAPRPCCKQKTDEPAKERWTSSTHVVLV
jgi:hypothetical protein